MKLKIIILALVILTIASGFSFAQTKTETETQSQTVSADGKNGAISFFSNVAFACVIGLGVAALGCAFGQGIAISKAVEGISRQPESSNKIQTLLLIGLAFIESVVIYVLVVVLILLFANPFITYIVK